MPNIPGNCAPYPVTPCRLKVAIRFLQKVGENPLICYRCSLFFLFFFFQVQPYNRKYGSIGHRVWSNILTELSINLFKAQ